MKKKRVAVLISGSGTNLQALMDAAIYPDYPAELVLVISNKESAYGLVRAQKAGIETRVIRHTDFASREAFDAALHAALVAARTEIVCLAGFMRLLTPEFVEKWRGRLLNIHPSLLPEFKGAHAIADALKAGAKKTGCTVHHVVAEMDAGEVLLQEEVAIEAGESEESLAQKIHAAEHRIYPVALAQLAYQL